MIAGVGMLALVSCEKNDDDKPADTPKKATLAFHIEHKMDSDDFAADQSFTLKSGAKVKISNARFYISGINIMDDAGGNLDLSDNFLLINYDTHMAQIAEIEAQHVHMMNFYIGIDSITNHTIDPTSSTNVPEALSAAHGMYWSWNSGYKFMELEGQVDADGDGVFENNFEYHVGLDKNLRTVGGMVHKEAEAGKTLEIGLMVNWARMFEGVDMTTELSAHGGDHPALTSRIADNAAAAIMLNH